MDENTFVTSPVPMAGSYGIANFSLVQYLGDVVVPPTFSHDMCLKVFEKKYRSDFLAWSQSLRDEYYSRPSRVLRPGDRLSVQLWRQMNWQTVAQERLDFLRKRKAVLLGAQGMALAYHNFCNVFPRGCGYYSMDEKERLWKDIHGGHWIPGFHLDRGGIPTQVSRRFDRSFRREDILLVFQEK